MGSNIYPGAEFSPQSSGYQMIVELTLPLSDLSKCCHWQLNEMIIMEHRTDVQVCAYSHLLWRLNLCSDQKPT